MGSPPRRLKLDGAAERFDHRPTLVVVLARRPQCHVDRPVGSTLRGPVQDRRRRGPPSGRARHRRAVRRRRDRRPSRCRARRAQPARSWTGTLEPARHRRSPRRAAPAATGPSAAGPRVGRRRGRRRCRPAAARGASTQRRRDRRAAAQDAPRVAPCDEQVEQRRLVARRVAAPPLRAACPTGSSSGTQPATRSPNAVGGRLDPRRPPARRPHGRRRSRRRRRTTLGLDRLRRDTPSTSTPSVPASVEHVAVELAPVVVEAAGPGLQPGPVERDAHGSDPERRRAARGPRATASQDRCRSDGAASACGPTPSETLSGSTPPNADPRGVGSRVSRRTAAGSTARRCRCVARRSASPESSTTSIGPGKPRSSSRPVRSWR